MLSDVISLQVAAGASCEDVSACIYRIIVSWRFQHDSQLVHNL